MPKIVECVPNISEGRDEEKIRKIVDAVKIPGVRLLHIDSSPGANRTVVTFIGEAQKVSEAAFRLIERAAELIDMGIHEGAHPCIGATDVCPFVPWKNISLEECAALSEKLARDVFERLKIPVYLYGAATKVSGKRDLPTIRRGGYRALEEKYRDPALRPDFWGSDHHPTAGASIMGARDFLVAYNVSLNTKDPKIAHRLAGAIRSSGMKQQQLPELKLPCCLALGWYMSEFDCAQVSTNLTKYAVTGMHTVYEKLKFLAGKLAAHPTGSQIVGLVPREAMLESGRFYHPLAHTAQEAELISLAAEKLGLHDKYKFNPAEKILEEKIAQLAPEFL